MNEFRPPSRVELQTSSTVQLYYEGAKEIPKGIDILARTLMIESGNEKLLNYTDRVRVAYRDRGEAFERATNLGLSLGYLYHHELALLRRGKVPVINSIVFQQAQREQNTEIGIDEYIQRNLPSEDSTHWFQKQINETLTELGTALGSLTYNLAKQENLTGIDSLITLLYATSRINRIFLIQQSLPKNET